MSSDKTNSSIYHTSIEQKLKSKNAANTYRYGTPKLRHLLREKCRIRVKEARQQGFSQNRIVQKIDLEDILRQELAEMENDINLQAEIYRELISELNDWFVDQIEGEENYLVEVAESQGLICPVCQKENLVVYQSNEKAFNYRCKCGANFNFTGNLEDLRQKLFHHVDEHEHKCLARLMFFVNSLTEQLESICDSCDYFCSL